MIKWPGLYMPPINLWNVPRVESEMITTTFKTGRFLIVARPTKVAPDLVHDFWAFEHIGWTTADDGSEILLYGDMWEEPKTFEGLDLDSMNPAFRGSVKWDGCSNWDFQPDNVLVHLCHPEDMDRLSDAVKACIAKAAELIPEWDGD